MMKMMKWRWMALVAVLLLGVQARAVEHDLNGDSNVDSLDYRLLAMRIIDKTADYDVRYDIDGNGTIDAVDANLLMNEMKRVKEFNVNGIKFRMVLVEAGTFTMGATAEQGGEVTGYEKPAHKVTLTKDYRIGETEVTQELFVAVMDTNYSRYNDDLKHPVECVTWNDCKTFIAKLNELTGAKFRLPTEAEWEFAARGGRRGTGYHYVATDSATYGYKYAGSDNIDEVAWYWNTSDIETHVVGKLKPNELGLYDMSGNVWEWCEDWFGSYTSAAATDPKGPSTGVGRVIRGGSFREEGTICRMSYRSGYQPGSNNLGIGFRLAMEP